MSEVVPTAETYDSAVPEVSVTDGHYKDPDPNLVDWVNQKFTEPDKNINATLVKAFEQAGVIKSIKEITQLANSLEHLGTIPSSGHDGAEPSEFVQRREEDLLLEFIEGDQSRNDILERVKNATARRMLFSSEDEGELVRFIKTYRAQNPEFTPAFRVLRVMLGIAGPENPDLTPSSQPPEQTRYMAPDIYFMLLQEERT